jgi:putative membrane protein
MTSVLRTASNRKESSGAKGEAEMELKATKIGVAAMMVGLLCGTALWAAESASPADKAFVAKVSQGGLYEVEAGKVAAMHGTFPVVKNFGVLESHDHEGVNSELKRIAGMTGVTITPGLNAEFTQRLAKLKAVPAAQFDAYYFSDMKQIHTKDEGLFVKEAEEGSAPYKQFAHHTAVLVNAHLGWLNTI